MILCALCTLLVLPACRHTVVEPPTPAPQPAQRTVLVYMEARNNLSGFAEDDLLEMQRASLPSDGRLLVYLSAYDSEPVLLEVSGGTRTVLKTYPDSPSAVDPEHMARVIMDAQAAAPALSYGMVFWSHSSGWRQKAAPRYSRGFGLEGGSGQMSITDLAAALRGRGLDFIFFDSCYMGSVEAAYELRHVAPYMVASECEVPTRGMPYDLTLPALFDSEIPAGLSRAIDLTVDFYINDTSERCPSTLSLINLAGMDELIRAVAFLPDPLPDDFSPQRLSHASPYKYLFNDFGQYFLARGGEPSVLADVIRYERHTPSLWGTTALTHCSGLSVYLPQFSPDNFTYDSYGYSSLEWARYLQLH